MIVVEIFTQLLDYTKILILYEQNSLYEHKFRYHIYVNWDILEYYTLPQMFDFIRGIASRKVKNGYFHPLRTLNISLTIM